MVRLTARRPGELFGDGRGYRVAGSWRHFGRSRYRGAGSARHFGRSRLSRHVQRQAVVPERDAQRRVNRPRGARRGGADGAAHEDAAERDDDGLPEGDIECGHARRYQREAVGVNGGPRGRRERSRSRVRSSRAHRPVRAVARAWSTDRGARSRCCLPVHPLLHGELRHVEQLVWQECAALLRIEGTERDERDVLEAVDVDIATIAFA